MLLYKNINRIIISRTDAIGDVILTLPLCGLIKKYNPQIQLIFLGRTYTQDVIACCEHVDDFINVDSLVSLPDVEAAQKLKEYNADAIIHVFPQKRIAALAKAAKINWRIGTTNRLHHWHTVNKFVALSRKKSTLHESQLNCKLLKGIGIDEVPQLQEMHRYIGFTKLPILPPSMDNFIAKIKKNIIIHPKSNASAREWGLPNYQQLISLLPPENFRIFISGSEKEKPQLEAWIKTLPGDVIDITGKFSLKEFIAFISRADFLIAASTGPLHIASACGIQAIGIYPPIKPMHPGRWQPIGKNSKVLCMPKSCNACRKEPQACVCMNAIKPLQVIEAIKNNTSL